MATRSVPLTALSEMVPGQEADVFVLLTAKEQLNTREGKPYFRVAFRDRGREVSFPIWDNSPLAADCRDHWKPGVFYKVRAAYRDTNYGPQLDIRKIREVVDADADDGFDPAMCLPQSRFEPQADVRPSCWPSPARRSPTAPLRALVESILLDNREELLRIPAARHNHHAFVAGWLEHMLERDADVRLSGRQIRRTYPDLEPPLDRGMVVAGGILHDIGKLRELDQRPEGTVYTAAGGLIGHMLQGRDIVREAAAASPLPADLLLRLEHLISPISGCRNGARRSRR